MGRACGTNGGDEECIWDIGGKARRKEIIKSKTRWVDNIKIDLREIGWDWMDWIDLAQDNDQWRALVSTVVYRRVP
jgi:predicted small integral membrane protein